ncbi:uncharacterized protein LOC132786241 [Drosophila nasuta]|uniref:uncharacterized protein LOC132786241 n=1 Tax=Drosophila nasuta TaxID=42062 RepID=UPI00295EE708|nr:uncharacterized protein LOC132786241 [Drosophila nasuta]
MNSAFALLVLITGQLLLASSGVQADRFFAVGERVDGDQLLLKDVQQSRPAGNGDIAAVVFNYNIEEPITYIEITSEENISAEVQFSYSDVLVVGRIRLVKINASYNIEKLDDDDDEVQDMYAAEKTEFDVIIRIYGFNNTKLNVDPALVLNRGTQHKGLMQPLENDEDEEADLVGDYADVEDSKDLLSDKIIEIGERQKGDDLIYQLMQTSSQDGVGNHSVTFYYVDRDYITYVKFILFNHFDNKVNNTPYTAPVVEYSHYTPTTMKATITDYNVKSLFAQMFMYGYRGPGKAPQHYKPYLEETMMQLRSPSPDSSLTPFQHTQVLLIMGGTTKAPLNDDNDDGDDDDDDDDNNPRIVQIRPEDMKLDHTPGARSVASPSGVERQFAMKHNIYALLVLMLFAVA